MPFFAAVSATLWPKGALKKFGVLWSVCSVVGLAKHAFDVGLGPTLQVILSYYEAAIGTALSPLQGLIQPTVIWFAGAFDWRVELQPYWTHLFVLLGLYMFNSASVTWRIGRKTFAVFRFALAVPIAAVCGVLGASIPTGDRIGTFVATSIPVLGLLAYNTASVLWRRIVPPPISKDDSGLDTREINDEQEMLTALSGAKDFGSLLARHLVAFVMIAIAVLVLPVSNLAAAPVGILSALVLLAIIVNLLLASSFSWRPRHPGDNWLAVIQRTGSGMLAISMLSVMLWQRRA